MRVIVLGASGFIGGHIVEALAASGWAMPIAASRSGATPGARSTENITLDACDPVSLLRALDGADAIVNCVGGEAKSIATGAEALFDCCTRLTSPPRVVHLSTISVYGRATGTVDEDAPLESDSTAYSTAKVYAERLALKYRSAVRLRPGIVYGARSHLWTERIARWIASQRLGDLGPGGEGYCNLVHVDDVVAATLQALRRSDVEGEAFNLSLPSPPTWNEYFLRFAAALNIPLRPIRRNRLFLEQYVFAPPLRVAELVTARAGRNWRPPPPIPPGLSGLFSQRLRMDVTKSETALGMQWKSLEIGLHESAAWFRGLTVPATKIAQGIGNTSTKKYQPE